MFSDTYSNLSTKLLDVSDDSDAVLNITSNTNPEASDLGSRDSVASSFSSKETASGYWEGSKKMIGWVFSGDTVKMLLTVFSGIFGFLAFYYIVKFIRNGI